MLINTQTKIAALIKHHPDALEAIVTLSPDFKKLRNPILRKLMAGRTSIAMAAKIGGCTPEDFFKKLQSLGFEADHTDSIADVDVAGKNPMPQYLKVIETAQLLTLDVLAMLAEGNDPLKPIQQKIKELQQGQVLQIINAFEPTPLIKLLEKQGFQAYVDAVETDLVETYFYKGTDAESPEGEANAKSPGDWEQ